MSTSETDWDMFVSQPVKQNDPGSPLDIPSPESTLPRPKSDACTSGSPCIRDIYITVELIPLTSFVELIPLTSFPTSKTSADQKITLRNVKVSVKHNSDTPNKVQVAVKDLWDDCVKHTQKEPKVKTRNKLQKMPKKNTEKYCASLKKPTKGSNNAVNVAMGNIFDHKKEIEIDNPNTQGSNETPTVYIFAICWDKDCGSNKPNLRRAAKWCVESDTLCTECKKRRYPVLTSKSTVETGTTPEQEQQTATFPAPTSTPTERACSDSRSFGDDSRDGSMERPSKRPRVDNKADEVETKDANGYTPLFHAAKLGNLSRVKHLVTKDGANVNAESENYSTPLHQAAYGGHAEVVEFLLSNDAKVDAQTQSGWMPIHNASTQASKPNNADRYQEFEKVVKLLVAAHQSTHGSSEPKWNISTNGYNDDTLMHEVWRRSNGKDKV